MTVADAARILELPLEATPEQIETRFLETRRKLEDKIAKAPTPGLQAKYRAALNEITEAFETMTLAADASSLPVLQQNAASPSPVADQASPTASPAPSGTPPAATAGPRVQPAAKSQKPKARSSEFFVVTLIAIAVLGAGAWWIVNLRAEKAEKARLAAIAEAEALRLKKEEEQRAADLVRIGNDARAKLAEARVSWDALEDELRDAERRTSELKSELRSFRDGPATRKAELSALAARQEIFTEWMKASLLRHAAKVSRARTEQALEAKEFSSAFEWAEDFEQKVAELTARITEERRSITDATSTAFFASKPAGVKFVFTDAYGRTFEGTTPAKIEGTPPTHLFTPYPVGQEPEGEVIDPPTTKLGDFTSAQVEARFIRAGWPDKTVRVELVEGPGRTLETTYEEGTLRIESLPAGVPFTATNALGWKVTGSAPATLNAVPPGQISVRLARNGYSDVSGTAQVVKDKTASITLDQRPQHIAIVPSPAETEVWVDGKFVGKGEQTLTSHNPGEHQLELRHPSYSRYRDKFTVKQEWTKQTLRFDFAALARRDIACSSCNGNGYHTRWVDCGSCYNGWRRCGGCNGTGQIPFLQGHIDCFACGKRGSVSCGECGQTGKLRQDNTCSRCSGRAYFSKLELNQ